MQALWNAPPYADTGIVYRDNTADDLTTQLSQLQHDVVQTLIS